jgi:sulfoxide reductase heme-binding subunit YedZ
VDLATRAFFFLSAFGFWKPGARMIERDEASIDEQAATVGRRRLRRTARRARNHLALGLGTLGVAAVLFLGIDSPDARFRASMASAYVALALFTVTLAFGPVNALRGRRYPVSTDIRRDFGIWSGLVAVGHVIIGLQVHIRGRMKEYFLDRIHGLWLPRPDLFGLANYTGLVAGLAFVALLVTSNDVSLRKLGTGRWVRLHALVVWTLVLTIVHGAAYQVIEKRNAGFIALFVALALAAIAVRVAAPGTRR